jgi:hypothetical protein
LKSSDGEETRVGGCGDSRHPGRRGAVALIGCPDDLLVYGFTRRQRGKLVMQLADGRIKHVRTRATRRGFVAFVYAGGPVDGRLAWTTSSGAVVDAARPGNMSVKEACRGGGVVTGEVDVPVPDK